MDIIIAQEPCETITNKFEIVMSTYTNSGEIYQSYQFLVDKKEIQRVLLEILIFEHQYFDHREHFTTMYDQKNYFKNNKGAFAWLNHYPDNENKETNYILDFYDVFYYNDKSEKYPVSIKNVDSLISEIRKINDQYQIGNENEWYSLSSMDKKYQNYCATMINFIDKCLLEKELSKEVKKNNKIKL
jgi:hypothetical protein